MADFTFLQPYWLLALLPAGLLIPWLKGNNSKTGLVAPHLMKHLGLSGKAKNRNVLGVLGLCWTLAIVALAGPSWQKTTVPAYNLAGARVLVMDMSRSMYATDISPNRLSQAKFKALDMLPGWKEGSTGLVAYAADGYVISPLTKDSSTLHNLVTGLSPEIMPYQGSNALAGINEAINLLKQAGFPAGDIVLVTDGMTAKESGRITAALSGTGYRLSILAVGTQEGAPITLPDGSLLSQSGQPVIAKVDLSTLMSAVQPSRGLLQLSRADNKDVDALVGFTDKPAESAGKSEDQELDENLNGGFWLLIPLLLLTLFSFRRGIVIAALFVLLPVDHAYAGVWKTDNQTGYEHFQNEEYQQAAESFSSPVWKGISQYEAGDYESAVETLKPLGDNLSRYNLGNAYAQAGKLDEAIETYEALLEDDPDNSDAKANLETVKQAKEQQQQQDGQSEGDNQEQNGENDQSQDESDQGDQSQDGKQGENSQQSDSGQSSQSQDNSKPQEGSQPKDGSQEESRAQESPQDNQAGDQEQNNRPEDSKNGENTNPEQQAQGEPEQEEESKEQAAGAKPTQEKPEEGKEDIAASTTPEGDDSLSASNPVLKKLEQVPDDPAGLIRAQILLQARQKETPQSTENSW